MVYAAGLREGKQVGAESLHVDVERSRTRGWGRRTWWHCWRVTV